MDNASLVGIDPATGSAKFTIPLEHWTSSGNFGCGGANYQNDYPPNIFQLIIAGDGYAYLAYRYGESSDIWNQAGDFCNETSLYTDHLRLLRVATDGTFQKIAVRDWAEALSATNHIVCESGSCGNDYVSATVSGTDLSWGGISSVATNADQGVALALNYGLGAYCSSTSYTNFNDQVKTGCVPEQDFHRLVLVSSSGSVVSDSAVNVTSAGGVFTPVLQAEDGTYFGTGVTGDNSMDAFDLSGNVKWSVPGHTPVMATADGGAIARHVPQSFRISDSSLPTELFRMMRKI